MVAACKKSCRPNLQAHVAPIELLPAVATGSSCSGACTRHHAGIVVCLSVRPNIVSRFLAKIMGVLPHVPLVRKSPGAMRAGLILFASGTIIWCEIVPLDQFTKHETAARRNWSEAMDTHAVLLLPRPDGAVDFRGRPASRFGTGCWPAAMFVLGTVQHLSSPDIRPIG
jgi:hypothetical protein